jgi:SagB-type dehydrogenase family enzyme
MNGRPNERPAALSEPPVQFPQTPMWAPWVYGTGGVPLDDPAESFHEASKLNPNVIDTRVPGAGLLESSPELRASTVRAVKRQAHRGSVQLPRPALPSVGFESVVEARRSERNLGPDAVVLSEVSTLLHAAYGVTHAHEATGQPYRAVPSAGALYPLEIYPVAVRIEGLDAGLYHFDPLCHGLERLRPGAMGEELEALTVYPQLFTNAAIVFFVTAMFWRTRFKYGLRGYRFALLEAGHVGQNLVLTATAFGLTSAPVGGFYDRRVEAFLRIDGVNEAPVYAVSIGSRA